MKLSTPTLTAAQLPRSAVALSAGLLALGQKRADAVARSLVLVGADQRRIETVSYGEERPKAEGGNEEAFALNRRAELSPR